MSVGMTLVFQGDYSDAATFLARNVALEGDLRYDRILGEPASHQLSRKPILRTHSHSLADSMRPSDTARQPCGSLGRPIIATRWASPSSPWASLTSVAGISPVRSRSSSGRSTSPARGSLSAEHRSSPRPWVPPTRLSGGLTRLPRWSRAPSRSSAVGQNHSRPALILLCAATSCLSAGRIEEAVGFAREALTLARRLGARGAEAQALCLSGDVASTGGDEDADDYYRQALAVAESRGMRPLVAHCQLGLGKMHHRTGDLGQAQEHLTIATVQYREMDMTYWLEQAEAELRKLG